MKQKLSWILEALFLILLLGITVLIYAPEQSEHILHIRMVQVTGKNKEKAIEQDYIIFVKNFKENEEPRNLSLIHIFPESLDFIDELPDYDNAMYIHKKMKTTYEIALKALQAAQSSLSALNYLSSEENLH